MDRFVTKRPRETVDEQNERGREESVAAKRSPPASRPAFDGVVSLALCPPVQSILKLQAEALELFCEYPVERWYNLGPFLPNRQLLFGHRPGSHRTPHSETMPPVLNRIFEIARAALMIRAPHFGIVPTEASGCAINRYAPTPNKKGSGLGPHRDKGLWKPLVVGVTLVESRRVVFSNDYKERATRRFELETKAGSVYAFRDEMYTQWFHESLKKGPSQQKTIYSITYRFFDCQTIRF